MILPLSSPALAFAKAAREFCAWCESPSPGTSKEVSASVWVAKLHSAALMLPEVEADNANGLPDLPEAAQKSARDKLACFNGWYYREFFDPDPTLDEEPVMGDVGDDLLDIYKDIKVGCLLFERGDFTEALWHWSFLHRIHWGRHAVGALLALHCTAISKPA